MPSTLSEMLLSDYNVYKAQTQHVHMLQQRGGFVVRPLRPNAERVAILESMVEWCRARHLEPRLWLYGLFKSRQWLFPPKLTPGCLMSEKQIPKYQKLRGLGFFRRRSSASAMQDGDSWDPNRDTTPVAESLKAGYAQRGEAQRCMSESMLRTLGFHPKSAICATCPLRAQCALNLTSMMPFDVIGLRLGTVTQEQAEKAARAAHGA